MDPINGREPDDQPLGTRQLADKLRGMVYARLEVAVRDSMARHKVRVWTLSSYQHSDAVCEATGELLESEMLALAVSWAKRFAELEERLAYTEKRLRQVAWGYPEE